MLSESRNFFIASTSVAESRIRLFSIERAIFEIVLTVEICNKSEAKIPTAAVAAKYTI